MTKRMTKIEIDSVTDEKISEVKTVWKDSDANKLIADGWKLLHAGAAHIDSHGFNAKICFVLGKVEIRNTK